MDTALEAKKDILMNYIMKNCLWQFNSRAWDREAQNENIIGKTTQLLCNEKATDDTSAERYYWAEAKSLVNEWECFPWIKEMSVSDIKTVMSALKTDLDTQLIKKSLNAELTDPKY